MIKIVVNGKSEKLEKPISISDFLSSKSLNANSVAVAINLSVVRRVNYDSTNINDGDIVEIVRPVGGGRS